MNTIEQARDVAKCLRALMRDNEGSAYMIAADTIDELIAELAILKQQEPVGVVVRVDSAMAPGCSYLQGTMIKNTPDGALLYLAAGAQSIPAGYQLVPMEPTTAMVSAYLEANKAYWERTDELPKPPHKWRLGTPFDATINSYKAMLAAAPVQAQEHPISSGHPDDAGFELWWSEHMPETVQSVAISAWNAAQPTIRDFRTVQSAQERKPLTDEVVRLANVALHEMPRPSTDWHEAAKRVCQAVSDHGIKEKS